MTTPTGQISLSNVHLEIYGTATGQQTLDEANTRTLAGKSTGSISMSDLKGKTWTPPATWTPNANGSYTASALSFAEYDITCSQTATWSYIKTGLGTTNIANNGTGTILQMSVTAGSADRSATWTVTSTAAGLTRNYTITVTALGDGSVVGVGTVIQQ